MFKRITILCVVAMLCLKFTAFSQSGQAKDVIEGGLQIGQQMPDFKLQAIGKNNNTISLSAYKGKLVILDFWATWCSPCLAMMPKMDSIQRLYPEKIQFIAVTYQKTNLVGPFLKEMEFNDKREYQIPLITEDVYLHKLFPHIYLPHYVWINGDGKIIAITGAEEVNESNILNVVARNTSLPLKKDWKLDYDNSKPLLINSNGGDGNSLLFHSLLTGRIEGLSSGTAIFRPGKGGVRMVYTNSPLINLYRDAWTDRKEIFSSNRILIDIKGENPFQYSGALPTISWRNKFSYNYEIIAPFDFYKKAWRFMREDLGRYFPQYTASLVSERRMCYVLVKTSSFKDITTAGGKPSASFSANGFNLGNTSVSILVKQLNSVFWQTSDYPVIDGSGISTPVDLEVSAKLTDAESVNKGLRKYGLEFKLIKKRIKVLKISETKINEDK